jgi:outer membrane protein
MSPKHCTRINPCGWLIAKTGVDINLQDGWLLNADVKKLWIDTDVHFSHGNGLFAKQKIDSLDIDPWVLAMGLR